MSRQGDATGCAALLTFLVIGLVIGLALVGVLLVLSVIVR